MTVRFFTVASDDNHHLQRLLSSAEKVGIEVSVLGLGKPYLGNGAKITNLVEALQGLDPEDIFVYVDAYDVIFLGNEDEILAKYLKFYDGKLLYGAEANFGMYSGDDLLYFLRYPLKSGRHRYLNAGTIMGRAGHALGIYEKIGLTESQRSDQMDTIRYFVRNPEEISVDFRQEVFGVNGGRAGLEDEDYEIREGRLYARYSDCFPAVFHVPGKHFIGFDKIAYALGFMDDIPEYSSAEQKRFSGFRRDHLICDRLCLDPYVFRLIKNWGIILVILGGLFLLGRFIFLCYDAWYA